MDIVVWEVDKEGFILPVLENGQHSIGQFVSEVFAFVGAGQIEAIGEKVTTGR